LFSIFQLMKWVHSHGARFIDSGGDIDAVTVDTGRQTALHIAAAAGHLDVVKFLVERGVPCLETDALPIVQSQRGHHCSPCFNHRLFGAGANIHVCDAAGNTAAHVASSEGVLDLLLAADRLNRQPAGDADQPSMQPAGSEADQPSMQPAAEADQPSRQAGAEAVKVESAIPAAPAAFDEVVADTPAEPASLPGPLAGMVSRVCASLPFHVCQRVRMSATASLWGALALGGCRTLQ
jgi:hypothetical protein